MNAIVLPLNRDGGCVCMHATHLHFTDAKGAQCDALHQLTTINLCQSVQHSTQRIIVESGHIKSFCKQCFKIIVLVEAHDLIERLSIHEDVDNHSDDQCAR